MSKRYFIFQVLWLLVSLLLYASVLISPEQLRFVGLIAFTIPLVVGLNLIVFIFSFLVGSKMKWVSGVCLLLSIPFWSAALQWDGNENLEQKGVKLLSYNVKWFTNSRGNNYGEVLKWIKEQDADIMCFQEFYPLKNIAPRLSQNGKYNVATDKDRFSVSIYSKYPIVQQGLLFDATQLNNIRYADININGDTVRVYNVHLQSMGMDTKRTRSVDEIESQMKPNLKKFINSHARRVEQMEVLQEHIKACPYPVMLAGDFNDIPFSYNYFQMRYLLNNAFEHAGKGFGFTFNDRIPFLRIDNQFVSEEWAIKAFKTFSEVNFSDHYPIIGIFEISR